LLIRWVEAVVEGVEGLDEGIAKAVLAILLAGIPKSRVRIEDK